MEDKIMLCKDCGIAFHFTPEEQTFYAARGLEPPVRCKDCRDRRRDSLNIKRVEIKCAKCGHKALVPFEPKEGRPVYCEKCFAQEKMKR